MDYKNVKQAKWAFRFNQPYIKLWKINPITGEETYMGDNFKRGIWAAYTWVLDNDKSWVSIKVRKDRIKFWVKYVEEDTKVAKHYKVMVGRNDEQRIAIGDPDEMVRDGLDWVKKSVWKATK